MHLRELRTIEEFRQVVALEHEVWGYTSSEDAVPVPMLIVSVKIGGLVIGAFDDDRRLVGFVYSLPGIDKGEAFHWSHMLGVSKDWRDRGVGLALKLEQRRRVLSRGFEVIEWTYDPLQALNAHFNFAKLGVVVRRYERDVYGESSSPLHRGTATDRFIAEWRLRSSQVVGKVEAPRETESGLARGCAGGESERGVAQGSALALVNDVRPAGEWIAPLCSELDIDADRLGVVIPVGFTEMQAQARSLAHEWRAATREIFEAYLPRGYLVVGFTLDRAARRGTYLLEKDRGR